MPEWDSDLVIIGSGPAGLSASLIACGVVQCNLWRHCCIVVQDGSVAAIAGQNYLEELKRG
jgi:hypothetical protein